MTTQRLADRTILIVDDDRDILASMELAFRGEGAVTQTCGDGNAAMHALQASRPDLVVLDMMLPQRSGLLVLEKLNERLDAPPVIMVTANQGRRHMSYAQSLGVAAYLNKPVSLQRLLDTAVKLLGR